MKVRECSRTFLRHSTRSPVARQQTIVSSVARQVWNLSTTDDVGRYNFNVTAALMNELILMKQACFLNTFRNGMGYEQLLNRLIEFS